MRVYCWGGPLDGKIIDVERLPFEVPLPLRLSLKDWERDVCLPTLKVGQYDNGPGDPRLVFWCPPI